MSYLLLIIENDEQRTKRRAELGSEAYERMVRFGEELERRGVLKATESLKPDGGVRVQVRGGKRSLVDGPFSEAKEIVGGFFLLDCKSQEEAIAIAGACPAAEWATVEVRELGPCA